MKKELFWPVIPIILLALLLLTQATCLADAIFEEDFESGQGAWTIDNGLWQVGVPTSGPGSAHGGTSVAATVLAGNYPVSTHSRLISPIIQLPTVAAGEEISLRFWQAFYYSHASGGYVQVSVKQSDGSWGAWTTLLQPISVDYDSFWSLCGADLTPYAGKAVKLGFYHVCDESAISGHVSAGWYLDDIVVQKGTPVLANPEGFEFGWNGWYAESGVWEIGTVSGSHSGSSCAATNNGGNYPCELASMLVSPTVPLPPPVTGEEIWLTFWQTYNYSHVAGAQLCVSEKQPDGTWTAWSKLVDIASASTSSPWTLYAQDLTAYAGKQIRIGFYHYSWESYISGHTSWGWNIDDVVLHAPTPNTPAKARQAANGDRVAVPNMVVTAVFGSYFYAQDSGRSPSSGTRVQWSGGGVAVKDVVNVSGYMITRSEGEHCISASIVTKVGSVDTLYPVGVTNKAIGGGDFNYQSSAGVGQQGILGATGLNNLGMLITTCGKVTTVGTGTFTIDDGSGVSPAVSVPSGITLPNVNDYVSVTGISACTKTGSDLYRLIKMRGANDLVYVFRPAPTTISGTIVSAGTQTVTMAVASAHPYADNTDQTWEVDAPAGTARMRAHFTQIDVESGYDFLNIKNTAGATTQSFSKGSPFTDVWTDWIDGAKFFINLTSDSSIDKYGFAMDKYERELTHLPMSGVTVTINPGGYTYTTGPDGKFTSVALAPGNYTVTATLAGSTFTPATANVTLTGLGSVSGVDFTAN